MNDKGWIDVSKEASHYSIIAFKGRRFKPSCRKIPPKHVHFFAVKPAWIEEVLVSFNLVLCNGNDGETIFYVS